MIHSIHIIHDAEHCTKLRDAKFAGPSLLRALGPFGMREKDLGESGKDKSRCHWSPSTLIRSGGRESIREGPLAVMTLFSEVGRNSQGER